MSATSIAKAFNNQIYNLLKSLSDRFPNVKEMKLALTGIDTIRTYNPKKSIDFFILHGYKYRELILSKDEKAFYTIDVVSEVNKLKDTSEFNKTINHYNINTKEYADIDIFEVVKKFWNQLDNDEHENMWKYLQVLISLCDKYIAESFNK
jgi:hypothetical protein